MGKQHRACQAEAFQSPQGAMGILGLHRATALGKGRTGAAGAIQISPEVHITEEQEGAKTCQNPPTPTEPNRSPLNPTETPPKPAKNQRKPAKTSDNPRKPAKTSENQ